MQLRFLIAEAIFKRYKQELTADERLKRAFSTLNNAIFQPMGLVAADGSVSLEFDLLIVKLKQELKLSDKARKHFRELGENNRSLLQDLQEALTGRIEEHLSRQENRPESILVLVDDLDKVRNPEQQKEIFDTNLGAILALPVDMVLTLPTGVLFGENRAGVRSSVTHLYLPRVLQKSPDRFDPEQAALADRLAYFQDLVDHRIAPGLVDPEAERCRLLADRALAQTALEAPTAEIEATLAALRAACKATGSTRIEAETMRDLARRLRPRASVPDRLALAEEAMTLFSAMPMPIEAALCMELQGDTLAARGLEAEAHSRYRAAAASLERRGVALWRARLGAKIEATGRA